jgi:hypothetical protein
MTTETPLTGRDTAASLKGLVIGFVAVLITVLVVVNLTNKKFEGHEATPAAAESH